MNKTSLRTKILLLTIGLILFITILLTTVFSYIQLKETEREMGTRALHVATTISFMPTIRNAFLEQYPEKIIQPIVQEIREFVGAEFVVVGNKDSIRYAHPDPHKIGKKMVGGDNDKALIDGEYYVSRAKGTLGPSLRGKAPIINEHNEIIGIVSVGFLVKDIKSIIWGKIFKISALAFGILILGSSGGVLLSRNIRKDIFGLEPHQIATLYQDRNAILSSIKEGVIAIDHEGNINMCNEYARTVLGITSNESKKIDDNILNAKMSEVLTTGEPVKDDEMFINNRSIIVNLTPIKDKYDKTVGVVSSFRDKTEINEMLTTLSEIRSYSEDLRAQTHEYTNKLYVLSGLLQLGHYDEAIDLIQRESETNIQQNKFLTELIKDKTVQAILLGKISKCSEKKIEFNIDTNTRLQSLPSHIDAVKLISILGNLIDNAIEAIGSQKEKREIHFFATDLGKDVVFEIADTGRGIPEEERNKIFELGYSTKKNNHRGVGLNIVKQSVEDLSGEIEFHNLEEGGAVFSIFFPKKI